MSVGREERPECVRLSTFGLGTQRTAWFSFSFSLLSIRFPPSQGVRELARRYRVTESEASRFMAKFGASFPKVRQWASKVKRVVHEDGFVATITKRQRQVGGVAQHRISGVGKGNLDRVGTPNPKMEAPSEEEGKVRKEVRMCEWMDGWVSGWVKQK